MKNMNMKELVKRFITAGLITSMMITPTTAAFAATTDTVPEAPEAPVAESYEDNDKIEEYNRKVDEYNASAEEYNKAVDEEYDAAVEETNRKNEEIAAHNESEEKRVAEANARNEQAARDAEERNRQIDEENAAGQKAAEEERDAKYESDLDQYNKDVEKYKADYAQYQYDAQMEEKIIKAGYQSVEHYNNTINTHYNEPAKKSVEKNANAPKLGTSDTYTVQEAEQKSGRMIRVSIEHNFYDTDISYKEEFEIDAYDIITFRPLSARAENTQPGYATFYYNTDEDHSMGYWMESDSYVGTNANYNQSGWECGDTHEVSFKDGKKRASDIEDIEVVYNYAWMALRTYKTYNIPTEPGAPAEPVKGEVNYENIPYVEAQLEDVAEAEILDFIAAPVRKAYLEMLTHINPFEVPQLPPAAPETPDTPDTPKTPGTTTPGSTEPTTSVTPSKTPAAPIMTTANTFTGNANAQTIGNGAAPAAAGTIFTTSNAPAGETIENGEVPLAEAQDPISVEEIADGSVAKTNADPSGAWALINLIAAIVTVLIAGIVSILGLKKKEEDEDEDKEADRINRKVFARGLGILTAVVSVILFIITEDMTLPMQLTDNWTLMMILILAVEAVLGIASKKTTREGEEKQEETESFEAELA